MGERTGSARAVARAACLAWAAAGLAGCGAGQDPVGTPLSWWHQLEGGAIAEQRPPPPGVDDPYPHVGTTPARPVVPSKAARDALTASLASDRTATDRLDVHDPLPPPAAVAGRPAKPAMADQASAGSSATLDAAGGAASQTPSAPPPPPAPVPTPEQQERGEPVLAMPPAPASVTIASGGPLPAMPAAPPPPPRFPGFDIPATEVGRLTPDYTPEAPRDTTLAFAPGTDELLPQSRPVLRRVAASGKTVLVRGHGDARSDTPSDQEAALRLALARAARAAEALQGLGVAPARIRIAATAFGRGGDVSVVQ